MHVVSKLYNNAVEAMTRHDLSSLAVPFLYWAWNIPIEHFPVPDNVRDLFVRYPDDIDVYRPVTDESVANPCDGYVRIVTSERMRVKRGVRVDQCCRSLQSYEQVMLYALYPQDFHHVFSPIDGAVVDVQFWHGTLRLDPSVSPCSNLRVHVLIRGEIGTVLLTLVGAIGVASIRLFCGVGTPLRKGQHMGHFDVGGSAILLALNCDTQPRTRRVHARAAVF